VYESSEELHETLQEKPALTFAAARAPHLTITVNDAVKYQEMDGFGPLSPTLPPGSFHRDSRQLSEQRSSSSASTRSRASAWPFSDSPWVPAIFLLQTTAMTICRPGSPILN